MIQIDKDLYFLEVPSDAKGYDIYSNTHNVLRFFTGRIKWNAMYIEDGDFKILGEISKDEISFDVKKLPEISFTIKEADLLLNDHDKVDLRKLLQSKGIYFENPMGKNRPSFNDYSSLIAYQGDCKEFDELENKVIRGKGIIIQKI